VSDARRARHLLDRAPQDVELAAAKDVGRGVVVELGRRLGQPQVDLALGELLADGQHHEVKLVEDLVEVLRGFGEPRHPRVDDVGRGADDLGDLLPAEAELGARGADRLTVRVGCAAGHDA